MPLHIILKRFINYNRDLYWNCGWKYFTEIFLTDSTFGSHQLLFQRRWWHPTPVLLPGKSHGRRSLVGCSPWGCEESDMSELLQFQRVGEGNGNPLQCSCLENPRDRGAWWAAIYGVAQSWTRLKRLSSLAAGRFYF